MDAHQIIDGLHIHLFSVPTPWAARMMPLAATPPPNLARFNAAADVVPDYAALGAWNSFTWRVLAKALGLGDTATREQIAASLRSAVKNSLRTFSADTLRGRVTILGIGSMLAAVEPTGLARSIAAARHGSSLKLKTFSAASESMDDAVTLRDFLTALGEPFDHQNRSATELWKTAKTALQFEGDADLTVASVAELLQMTTGSSEAEVHARLAEIADVADVKNLAVETFSASSTAGAASRLPSRIVTLGVAALLRDELSGLARAIAANKREHADRQ